MRVLVGLSVAANVRADAPPALAGQFTASALTTTWSIGDWGDACGPKPSGGGEHGGAVIVDETGGELTFTGVGHPYTTTACWEQLPGLVRASHAASAQSWRTVCKSPPGDPRQSTLVTTVTAINNDQISFDETGQYQFVIKDQNCTASVRRDRFYRRVQATAAATATTAAPAPAATSTPALAATDAPALAATVELSPLGSSKAAPVPKASAPVCALPGPPARIEVRPSSKLIRPGESFDFTAAVVDSRGCHLGIAPSFRLDGDANGVTVASTGKVHVDDGAPEGVHQIVAAVGARSVNVTLDVVSRERYDALLAQGGYDPSGASTDAAVARLESGSVGAHSTVLEDDSGKRRTLFVAIVGSAALALGLLGLALVRRSRKRALERSVPARRVAPPPPAPAVRATAATVCPTCREEFAPGAQFCPRDGNRLLPLERGTVAAPTGSVCPVCGQGYDPGISVCPKHDEPLVPPLVYAASRTAPLVESRKICPVCGAQFTGESQFCGTCGAALVPVN
ncbi:MAG TPA: zinc ribbon domain-containing protein [Polyangiaceae bacterium]|nr:zinc ribbon domain-containing protein [Polyangiaceae bacterium]